MALTLETVRRLAKEEGLQETYVNEISRVVSFTKPGNHHDDRIRINVYYTTGTVGTCLNHPWQGRTQLFRRNVLSDEEMRTIFRNPRVHTGAGYYENPATKRRKLTVPPFHEEEESVVVDEETAARKQMELLQQEAIRLAQERKAIDDQMAETQSILNSFESKRREQAETAKREQERIAAEVLRRVAEQEKQARTEAQRVSRGKQVGFYLTDSDHISEIFDETVTCIACGGEGTIMLYENGGWAWSSGLPNNLYNKLKGRQKWLPKPIYVAMGSMDRYYIEFADGKAEWVGCDEMTKILNKDTKGIASVAFGEHCDSYFIVFKDGGYSYQNVPQELDDLVDRRKGRADLTCVSLGPDGEYYLAARNGRSWWGGMTTKSIQYVDRHNGRIKFLDFGADGSYLFRYN